jgi:archaellum component FlaG (FlaF/FlaG flagellin family)
MSFKLREFSDLVGIDKETSTYGTPVFIKNLGGEILGEANNDGTIFIDKSLKGKAKQEAVNHEKVHLKQMDQGRFHYDDNTVTWKKDTKSPARVYKRINGQLIDEKTGKSAQEGGDFEWEREAYEKQ